MSEGVICDGTMGKMSNQWWDAWSSFVYETFVLRQRLCSATYAGQVLAATCRDLWVKVSLY